MAYEVRVRVVEASPLAVVAATTTWGEFPRVWPALLDQVYAAVRAGAVIQTGHNVMRYLDDQPAIEVGVQVAGPFEPHGNVVPSALPACRVATTIHRGGYEGLGDAYDALLAWCHEQGHALTRERWEVYGDFEEDPADIETEITWRLLD